MLACNDADMHYTPTKGKTVIHTDGTPTYASGGSMRDLGRVAGARCVAITLPSGERFSGPVASVADALEGRAGWNGDTRAMLELADAIRRLA